MQLCTLTDVYETQFSTTAPSDAEFSKVLIWGEKVKYKKKKFEKKLE